MSNKVIRTVNVEVQTGPLGNRTNIIVRSFTGKTWNNASDAAWAWRVSPEGISEIKSVIAAHEDEIEGFQGCVNCSRVN